MIPLYQRLATKIQARQTCVAVGNKDWQERHEAAAYALVQEHMPSGSGIDSGVSLILEESHVGESEDYEEAIVFHFGYHPMNEHGFYLAWQHYELTVRPTFAGIALNLVRMDDTREDDADFDQDTLDDYLGELLHDHLTRLV